MMGVALLLTMCVIGFLLAAGAWGVLAMWGLLVFVLTGTILILDWLGFRAADFR